MDTERVPSPPLPPLQRHALVVANSRYYSDEFIDLVAPAHDAERMASMLADPDICGFEVTKLIDATSQEVGLAMNQIFNNSDPNDFILVYFSGHGVKDGNGRLYFATRDTDLDTLPATSVSARYLRTLSDDSECSRQVVILDCCNSGAYDKGGAAGTLIDTDPDMLKVLPSGRCILTASRRAESAQQRRIEDGAIDGSVFTSALVEGIVTGEADTANTGLISVEDAYRYAYLAVLRQHTRQHPQFAIKGAEGAAFLLARNPVGVASSVQNVAQVVALLAQPNAEIQQLALQMLGHLAGSPHPGTAASARRTLLAQADGVDATLAALARSLLPQPTPMPDESRLDRAPDAVDDHGYSDPAFETGPERAGRLRNEYEAPNFDEFADLPDIADPQGVFNPRRILPLEDEPSTLVARFLFPTERFRGEWKRHPFYLIRAIVVAGSSAAGAYLVHLKTAAAEALLAHPLPDWVPFELPTAVYGVPRTTVLMWLLAVIALVGGAQELSYATWRLVLTNKRMMVIRGAFRRRVFALPLLRANDMRFRQSLLGRAFGWGTFTVYSGPIPVRRVCYVPNPNELYLRFVEEMYEPQAVEARLGGGPIDDDDL